ncbi:unnamed protein product [Moneuplotes crassus]|uniref:Uncharacterized protein n=1 Tax=Euplotes crassus TaxID=5936 RepID=A0AAD1U757_EUPCR|nr:unnamed protein product [Moneuplotes crassus]
MSLLEDSAEENSDTTNREASMNCNSDKQEVESLSSAVKVQNSKEENQEDFKDLSDFNASEREFEKISSNDLQSEGNNQDNIFSSGKYIMKEVNDHQADNFDLPILENDEAKSEKTSLHNYIKNQRSLDEEDQKENKSKSNFFGDNSDQENGSQGEVEKRIYDDQASDTKKESSNNLKINKFHKADHHYSLKIGVQQLREYNLDPPNRARDGNNIKLKIEPELISRPFAEENTPTPKISPAILAVENDHGPLNTVTEDEGTEEKSNFSSRQSFLESNEKFRVKINNSDGTSIHQSEKISTKKKSPDANRFRKISSDSKNLDLKYSQKDLFLLTSGKDSNFPPSEQKSIRKLDVTDISESERLEIEKTVSQLSSHYEDHDNVVHITQSSERNKKSRTFKTKLQMCQKNFPKAFKIKQNFFKYKTIEVRTRLNHLKGSEAGSNLLQITEDEPKDGFRSYLKAIQTARKAITTFQKREVSKEKSLTNLHKFESLASNFPSAQKSPLKKYMKSSAQDLLKSISPTFSPAGRARSPSQIQAAINRRRVISVYSRSQRRKVPMKLKQKPKPKLPVFQ